MISNFLLIVYTPIQYLIFTAILYLLTYFRDPLRFVHPHKQGGQELWREVLFYLNLERDETISIKSPRKVSKGLLLFLLLAAASPISGWIVCNFVISSMALKAALSILFQFLAAVVVLFAFVIPSFGTTAHIWKKHVSRIGAPARRLGSRVLHLSKLKKGERKVADFAQMLPSGKELTSSAAQPALPSESAQSVKKEDSRQ